MPQYTMDSDGLRVLERALAERAEKLRAAIEEKQRELPGVEERLDVARFLVRLEDEQG